MNEYTEYVSTPEADAIINRWAQRGASVLLTEELGDFAIFVQRPGHMSLIRPGLPVHTTSSGDSTALFTARFGEIVHVFDDAYELLALRRPAGVAGLEVTLVADFDEALQPEDVLLMAQAARSIRPPVE